MGTGSTGREAIEEIHEGVLMKRIDNLIYFFPSNALGRSEKIRYLFP